LCSFGHSSVNSQPLQRAPKIVGDLLERQRERRPPSNQHIVIACRKTSCSRQSDHFPKPALDPVTLDRSSDLSRHGKTYTDGTIIAALAHLQDKSRGRQLFSGRRGEEIGSPSQPIHGTSHQALSRLRPRARRAAITLRPPFFAMRARKPWRRLRTSLLGW
jgi:hypothetical protein